MSQNRIDATIAAELLVDELPEWHVGVCTVRANEHGELVVTGENDHLVGRVDIDGHVVAKADGHDEYVDLDAVADAVNGLIEREHAAL